MVLQVVLSRVGRLCTGGRSSITIVLCVQVLYKWNWQGFGSSTRVKLRYHFAAWRQYVAHLLQWHSHWQVRKVSFAVVFSSHTPIPMCSLT